MSLPDFSEWAPMKRRRFLEILGVALASPAISPALRFAANDLVAGTAYAQSVAENTPTYFMEINLRDQWDFGHVFPSPGLATHTGLRRGPNNDRCAIFFDQGEFIQERRNFYLTPDSQELAPHLDTIACCELFELSMGRIHGHEAGNATRSPGRSYDGGAGRMPMYENEPSYTEQGNEPHFSSTPTPASMHNFYSKQVDPSIRNGVTFKGISRFHNCWHFGAGMPGAELDRKQSVQALLDTFPDRVEDLNIVPTPEEADAVARLLRKVDERFFEKHGYSASAKERHEQNLTEVQNLLYSGDQRVISLPLTDEERAYWSEGVPPQVGQNIKANIWEQVAYGFKLFAGDMARTYAVEFDYVDVHDQRTEDQMRVMARQTVLPLVRLIESLKEEGIYDRTLIAIYNLDGGRAPSAASYGNEGKNTVILAGGMIEGGYYGDISVASDTADGHRYQYHVPDPDTGNPRSPIQDNSGRLPGATIWRTVMKALGMPESMYGQFPDVQGHSHLPWLLRS
jgi:hypothetical protein